MTGRIVLGARVVTGLWALGWAAVSLVFAIGEGSLLHVAVPGLLFVSLALIAWRWEAPGSILLVLSALVLPVVFRGLKPLILLFMAIPPLLGGILFFLHWRLSSGGRLKV